MATGSEGGGTQEREAENEDCRGSFYYSFLLSVYKVQINQKNNVSHYISL